MLIREDVLRQSEGRARVAGIIPASPAASASRSAPPSAAADEMVLEARAIPLEAALRGGRIPIARRQIPGAVIEKRRANLSFAGARPSDKELERMINGDDLVDEFFLHRALIAARPVCRIAVRDPAGSEIGYATGFLIGPELLLTNWHVFRDASEARHSIAEFEYTLDVRGEPVPSHRFTLQPERFFHSNRDLDYALVAVSPQSIDGDAELQSFGFHRLVDDPHKVWEGEWITIIQHPSGARRQYAIRDNLVIRKQASDTFMWYQSDTAQGSSGAPAFNDSFQVVALHHSGKARQDGDGMYVLRNVQRVASLDGIDDSLIDWVANEGLRVSVLCRSLRAELDSSHPIVQQLFGASSAGGDIMSTALSRGQSNVVVAGSSVRPEVVGVPAAGSAGLVLPIPNEPMRLHISIGYGAGEAAPAPAVVQRTDASGDTTPLLEKLARVWYDRDYSSRTGYDPDFLGTTVPLPRVTNMKLVSKLEDGEHVIPYEHFSVVQHKKRRLALFTASNVAGGRKLRTPEPGDYSRDALGGIGENDSEMWITDERIPGRHQLPDRFFTKDRAAFDKGHIVRREDVCWRKTRQQVRRANGDTFHTTNCSPQVAGFNRGGEWGQLENLILAQVKKKGDEDKFSVFAGPVFGDDDEFFDGYDDKGPVRIQIPQSYWKIVVDREDGQLRAFAFVLEQDLSKVKFTEAFEVPAEWTPAMISIEELEGMLTGIAFPQELKEADQFATATGTEMVTNVGVRRRGA